MRYPQLRFSLFAVLKELVNYIYKNEGPTYFSRCNYLNYSEYLAVDSSLFSSSFSLEVVLKLKMHVN